MSSLELGSYRPKSSSELEEDSHSIPASRTSSYDSVLVDVRPQEDTVAPQSPSKVFQVTNDITLTQLDHKMDYTSSDNGAVPSLRPSLGNIIAEQKYCSSDKKANVIVVQQACKSYGRGKKKVKVLDGLDMCVPQGAIYGLLGPSGCGKTTLLGCLVNRLVLDTGDIYLYGYPPGSTSAAVPGHRVGYMPQELALYAEFSIGETLSYFGRIHHLSPEKVKERTSFLVSFLDLPEPGRLINQLSGGQQRRASLAAALVHEPELLILDEPTVGVDPLLRSSIWQHLLDICSTGRTTIIITTHYIEEARQADKVGLMRGGRLLAETSPSSLIHHFKIPSLEDIFLKLCLQAANEEEIQQGKLNSAFESDTEVQQTNTPGSLPQARGVMSPIRKEVNKVTGHTILKDSEDAEVFMSPWIKTSKYERVFSSKRFTALLIKNFIRLWRNLGFLVFSFLIPPLQTVLFCLAVGGTPYGLGMAVVNEDLGVILPVDSQIADFPNISLPNITRVHFSEDFLDDLNHHTLNLHHFDDFEAGHQSVLDGKNWGLLHFHRFFSLDFLLNYGSSEIPPFLNRTQFNLSEILSFNISEASKVHIYMDNTNSQIAITIWLDILKAMEKFVMDMTEKVAHIKGLNFTGISFPMEMHDPIYGSNSSTFTEFMAPGVILSITYFMAVGLTALSFVVERKEGLLDRSWVAGVQSSEVMLAFLATQMFVMLIQIALILVFMFLVFKIPCEGNMVWVILISILQGFCGMSFGLMTSALSKDENTALMMALGIFYPLILLSGIVWPVQGMPTALRYIAILLPQTYACEAIRAVLYRGWDITYPVVYLGIIVTIVWLFIHLVITLIAVRVKK